MSHLVGTTGRRGGKRLWPLFCYAEEMRRQWKRRGEWLT